MRVLQENIKVAVSYAGVYSLGKPLAIIHNGVISSTAISQMSCSFCSRDAMVLLECETNLAVSELGRVH